MHLWLSSPFMAVRIPQKVKHILTGLLEYIDLYLWSWYCTTLVCHKGADMHDITAILNSKLLCSVLARQAAAACSATCPRMGEPDHPAVWLFIPGPAVIT